MHRFQMPFERRSDSLLVTTDRLCRKGRECVPRDVHQIGEEPLNQFGAFAVLLFGSVVMCNTLKVYERMASGWRTWISHCFRSFRAIVLR